MKILVIGNSCSGKTTLARKLGKQQKLPWIDLDELHWLPNWIERDDAEFKELIHSQILSHEKWIVSGNYTSLTKGILWPAADTIIWLNYSLPVVLYRFVTRTFRRITTQEKCCNGNTETFRHVFLSKDNLLSWILFTHHSKIRRYKHWKEVEFKDKKWLELRSPSQTTTLGKALQERKTK